MKTLMKMTFSAGNVSVNVFERSVNIVTRQWTGSKNWTKITVVFQ